MRPVAVCQPYQSFCQTHLPQWGQLPRPGHRASRLGFGLARPYTTPQAVAAPEAMQATQSIDLEYSAEGDYCMPGEVSMDSESSADANILTVEVKDYPGLLRVVAWVLNGLDVVVTSARLATTDDGYAHNRFWLNHRTGRKLDISMAQLVAERVGDFVVYCTPNKQAMLATRFGNGPVTLDNRKHEEYSVVEVRERVNTPGTLLQCAAAISGIGVTIHEAVIQGCTSCGKPETDPSYDHSQAGRLFQFSVTETDNGKLDFARATALIYTLNMALGLSTTGDLLPPNATTK